MRQNIFKRGQISYNRFIVYRVVTMYSRIAEAEQRERKYSHPLPLLISIAFRQLPWIFLFFSSLHLYGSETNLRHVLQQTSIHCRCVAFWLMVFLFYHIEVWDINIS